MKKNSPEKIFVAVIAVTLLLLVASLVTMTVLLITDGGDEPDIPVGGTPSADGTDSETDERPKDGPLYPTKPTRTSYLSTVSPDVKTLTDEIKSNNTILVDLSTYKSTVEKGADEKIYPASMTKVMTLLVACEMVTDLDEKLVVTEEQVAYKTSLGASGNPFVAGEAVRVEDLLYLVIYDSDTIACLALADRLAGSEEAFAALMTDKAKSLGLTSTNFKNSTGLFHEEHYTTCREMAAIMAYALENPLAKQILTSYAGYTFTVYQGDTDTVSRELTAWSDWYSVRFGDNPKINKGAVVVKSGKTGWEEIPMACFVTYAESKSGKQYINVVVGRSNKEQSEVNSTMSTADVKKIYTNFAS